MDNAMAGLDAFISQWDGCDARDAFLVFRQTLEAVEGVRLDFKIRPGITCSLRGAHPAQQGRELFVLIDIIDDDPDQRWLSVCFYDDLVTDAKEQGDWVPGGLMGENARCFNVDEADEDLVVYVAERISEAGRNAAK